jgi:hypothetical protein
MSKAVITVGTNQTVRLRAKRGSREVVLDLSLVEAAELALSIVTAIGQALLQKLGSNK